MDLSNYHHQQRILTIKRGVTLRTRPDICHVYEPTYIQRRPLDEHDNHVRIIQHGKIYEDNLFELFIENTKLKVSQSNLTSQRDLY